MYQTETSRAPRNVGLATFFGVQYLRAFAAVAVVVFHASQHFGVDLAKGARGVDVFFVISGFIMWMMTGSKETKPISFLLNRVKRIVPLYWLATAAMTVFIWLGLMRGDLSISSLLQSLFFVPHIAVGAKDIWPILVPGWSLNYEMFFYVVFAAFLFIPTRVRLLGLTCAFVALISSGILIQSANPLAVTYTNPLMGHFLGGIWVAEGLRRGAILPTSLSILAIAGGLLALGAIPWGGAGITIACGFASIAVVWGVVSLDIRNVTPKVSSLLFAGDASYSIYLWHGFAISAVSKIVLQFNFSSWMSTAAAAVGGVMLGMVVFMTIESQIKSLLSSRRAKPHPALTS